MFWIVLIVLIALIAVWTETLSGKMILGCGMLALGSIILYWITDALFLFTAAKICLILIVIAIFFGGFIKIIIR